MVLTASLVSSQSIERRIRSHYERAQKATQEGRFEEAEGEYSAVLKLDPSLAEAHANLGMVYYLQFKYGRAAESYKRALKIRPTLNRARFYLGCSEFYLGDYQNSMKSLEAALAEDLQAPFRKLARVTLARNYLALDQTEKAIRILKALSEESPEDTDILYMLGKGYLRLSIAPAEKLGLAGDHPRAHQMLAENFANQGKFKEAIDEYRAALSRGLKIPAVYYALGLLLVHEGQVAEGQQHLAAAVKMSTNNESARDLLERSRAGLLSKAALQEALTASPGATGGMVIGFIDPALLIPSEETRGLEPGPEGKAYLLYRRGEFEPAAALLKEYLVQNSGDVDALYWLVKSYQSLSVRAFSRIAEVGPDSARAHQLLAESFEKQERFREAVGEYEHVLKQNPRLPGVHYAKGLALMRMRNWGEAQKAFNHELEIDPFNAGANFRLGQLAYRAANYDEALHFFSRAIEIYSDFGEARLRLSQVLVKKGQHREALPHLLAAAKLLPDDHTIHFQLFRAYRALGQNDQAQKELQTFQRKERELKEATERKAAQSIERIDKARRDELDLLP